MGPDIWELFEDGNENDEIAAIIRLARSTALPQGVRVVTQFGDIVTVRMKRGDLPKVSGSPEVVGMSSGELYYGPDIETESIALPSELSSDSILPTDTRRPKDESATGRGVVVGFVDWGFDFAHPDFRSKDGKTRILALWDQRGGKRADSPSGFGYGTVHDLNAIDRALKEKDPYLALHYHPADADTGIGCHGTHVASIAAGTGADDRPVGIAPDADLVMVHNASWDEADAGKLGDSVTLLEAIDFVARTAGDRPWVINLSMGRHGEQHDGSTLIEQGLDAAIRIAPGRAVCLSAGNYFNKRIHASGQLRPTQERTLIWEIPEGKPTYNQAEFWYSWQDKFELSVRSPDGSIVARARLGERAKFMVGGKEVGNLYHRGQEPNNLDNHIVIFLYKEAPAGDWELTLSGIDVIDGRYHAWIERDVTCPSCQSHFRSEDADSRYTTGTICNGRRTIAVGAYSNHDSHLRLAAFSSEGPTRDGRLKPDLCAPGVSVLAARSAPRKKTDDTPMLTRMSGTSMAAPHVSGTVALMFQAASRRMRIEETHNLLLENAQRVSVPDESPGRIGIGFLDITEAVNAARQIDGTKATRAAVPVQAAVTSHLHAKEAEMSESESSMENTEAMLFEAKAEMDEEVSQGDQNTFHRIANDITGAFEGGKAGTLNLYDLGVISYGKHQATLASGTLYGILKRFTEVSSSQTSIKMAGYLERVKKRDESLREDSEFIRLLRIAATEPEMGTAQDEEFSRQYWEPAKKAAAAANVKTALGYALFYDTNVQGGLSQIRKTTETKLGGKIGDTVSGKVIAEHDSLHTFVDERIQRHLRIAANQKKSANTMIKEAETLEAAALAATDDSARAAELKREASQKRKKASQYSANASALEVSATKTRGPSWTALLESGDLDLSDGDEKKIHLHGKKGVSIAALSPGATIDATTLAEFEGAAEFTEEFHIREAECNCGKRIAENLDWFESDADDSWFSESLAEDLGAACSPANFDCSNPPDSDLKLVRPKGKPQGDFVERTQGDPNVNLALQLTGYDVNAYLVTKFRHIEALTRVVEFITDRIAKSNQPIGVTITGSASRTGGAAFNDALSCKRALCAASNIRLGLSGRFPVLPDRVQINPAGEGFTRATCNGSDCELDEWRSVLVQVHTANNPPTPIPVIPKGWDKYTIRCCSFHTTLILEALLSDLVDKGLPNIPPELKGRVVGLLKKGLEKLKKALKNILPKAARAISEDLSEFLKFFPAQIIRENGTFEIRERENSNPRVLVLCYEGHGLRIIFPRKKVDEFIDEILGKVPGVSLLPEAIRKEIREEIKNAIPDVIKTLAQPIESDTSGPVANFNLLHPRDIKVFEGRVQIGKGIWAPGRVNVEFDSPVWHLPDPQRRPHITTCPGTTCNDSGVETQVGDGRGMELFSITAGNFAGGTCVCTPIVSSTSDRESVQNEVAERTLNLAEMADEIVARAPSPRPSAEVMYEMLSRHGLAEGLREVDSAHRVSAGRIFDEFAYPSRTSLRQELEENFEVVGVPGARLEGGIREGDVVLRRYDVDTAHVAVVANSKLRNVNELLSEGMTPESFEAGDFAQVIESGSCPHTTSDKFARQLTDGFGRILNDIVLLRLATPPPQAVTINQQASSSQSKEDPLSIQDVAEAETDEEVLTDNENRYDMTEIPPVVTRHQITVGGKILKYTATAGRLPIKSGNGQTEALMFFVAYALDDQDARNRPLTFLFNGGPGAASLWLHVGAVGPRKVMLEREGFLPPPPYRIVNNPYTLLDQSDLVFIDAIGTGFSRAANSSTFAKFWGVKGDIESFSEFIRLYITRYERWGSPLYLLGESYGTLRAAGIASYLMKRGISFNGITLLSTVLNYQTLETTKTNDLPYTFLIPTFTMVAGYHKKLPSDLAQDVTRARQQAEKWAAGEYAQALAKGDALSAPDRQKVIEQMSRYTGLGEDVLEDANLRVDVSKFTHYLLLDKKLRVGRFDGRFIGPDPSGPLDTPFYDPTDASTQPPFTSVFNNYVRTELGYKTDMAYYTHAQEADFDSWNWGSAISGFPDTATAIREAIVKNPYLKILVMEGYYDLATPYSAANYTIDHLELPQKYRENISFATYDAGHMIYLPESGLRKMKSDQTNFIVQSSQSMIGTQNTKIVGARPGSTARDAENEKLGSARVTNWMSDTLWGASETDPAGIGALPAQLASAVRNGAINLEIGLAILSGEHDADTLTNMVFFARHPERPAGQRIQASDTRAVHEWVEIRDHVIRPLMQHLAAAPQSNTATGPLFLGLDDGDVDENHNSDWVKAKTEGPISFAIIRAHTGWRPDHVFKREWPRIKDAGIVRGAYLFLSFPNHKHSVRPPDPLRQVEGFIKTVGDLEESDFPPALDVEFPGNWTATGMSQDQLLAGVRTAWHALKDHYRVAPLIYTSAHAWRDDLKNLSAPDLTESPLWLTPYPFGIGGPAVRNPDAFAPGGRYHTPPVPPSWGSGNWWIHQYQGDAKGLPGFRQVDMNRFNTMIASATGQRVRWVQRRLGISETGTFDAAMEASLKVFQQRKNLTPDGIVDPRTFAFLCWSNP